MTDAPGTHLDEEPHETRAPKGSPDTGGRKAIGESGRSTFSTADKKSDTSVLPQGPQDPDSPNLQSGAD
jgi:hypothetical protein